MASMSNQSKIESQWNQDRIFLSGLFKAIMANPFLFFPF